MNTLVKKLIVAATGLALAAAPLAASAQNWHNGGGDRGGYRDNRGGQAYSRPVYTAPYVNGYFGFAPGGFQGYYYNGGWYHHRRWSGGIWIYF
jgi:hypothetical protein